MISFWIIRSMRLSSSSKPILFNFRKDIRNKAMALGFSVLGILNKGLKLTGDLFMNCVKAMRGHFESRSGRYLKMGLLRAS